MIDHGIHAGIAGTTVMLIGALTVEFPLVATTNAVKLCGAAAGVASTVKTDAAWPDGWEFSHGGLVDVINPDVGNPSTSKQIFRVLRGNPVNVRLILALSPTLMTTDDGLAVRTGSDCVSLGATTGVRL
ncbi:MAG TPA: hypothetical protein VK503_03995 [Candidatus Bathyarchaeia archaeon]|nr:hypothetical protein [Candidatus Bathyarchaeia archaeon]